MSSCTLNYPRSGLGPNTCSENFCQLGAFDGRRWSCWGSSKSQSSCFTSRCGQLFRKFAICLPSFLQVRHLPSSLRTVQTNFEHSFHITSILQVQDMCRCQTAQRSAEEPPISSRPPRSKKLKERLSEALFIRRTIVKFNVHEFISKLSMQ